MDELYTPTILQLAANISKVGRLEFPDATATTHSRLCGSTVTVDIAVDGDRVTDFAHVVRACVLGQAAAAIMARGIVGATATELRAIRTEMREMLRSGELPASGRFRTVHALAPVRSFRARHASVLLTFDAVVEALDRLP